MGAIRCESTGEEKAEGRRFLTIKMKPRAVVGKGEKSPLSDPGSELRLGREKEKKKNCER